MGKGRDRRKRNKRKNEKREGKVEEKPQDWFQQYLQRQANK